MLTVKKEGILLKRTDSSFENEGVLNPAVIYEGGFIHLFYRGIAEGNYSSIGYCRLKDPFTILERLEAPVLFPEFDYESHGVEDPRIVKIDDLFYMTYTAYDGVNALGALAISKDLIHFEKKGIIVPKVTFHELSNVVGESDSILDNYRLCNQVNYFGTGQNKEAFIWDKDVVFFPRKINGKFYILHRIKPYIQVVAVNDLNELTPEFWSSYLLDLESNTLLTPKYGHEMSYIGAGCPPIETEYGWILIYHGVHDAMTDPIYSACVALLDLDNPSKEIARLPYALFKPELDWELRGLVKNVCFPTGAIVIDDMLYIYYGADDDQIGLRISTLIRFIKRIINPQIQIT